MGLRELTGVFLIVITLTSSSAGDNVVILIRFTDCTECGINFFWISGEPLAGSSSQEVESFLRETAYDVLVVAIGLGPNFLEERTPDATIMGFLLIDKLHFATFDLAREVIVNGYHGGFTFNEDLEGVDALLRVGPDLRDEDLLDSFVSFSDRRAGSQEVAVTKFSLLNVPRIVLCAESGSVRDDVSGSSPLDVGASLIRMDGSMVVREVFVFVGLVCFQNSLVVGSTLLDDFNGSVTCFRVVKLGLSQELRTNSSIFG